MRGVSLIPAAKTIDSRGSFTKILKFEDLTLLGNFTLEETFFSKSSRGVVRGMHLQVGKAANWRIIQVISGSAFDVLLDLRSDEPTYKNTQVNLLNSENPHTLLVPPGVAHGFQALTDTEIIYLTSHKYEKEYDTGVNPFSLDIDWPIEITALSDRDKSLPNLEDFRN